MVLKREFYEVLAAYGIEKRVTDVQVYGNGHINDTNLVTYTDEKDETVLHKLIIQTINTSIRNRSS